MAVLQGNSDMGHLSNEAGSEPRPPLAESGRMRGMAEMGEAERWT